MIIAGLVQVFRDAVGSSESSTPEPFAVGDCLAMNSTTMEFVKLACSDPNAQQKVVGIEPEGGFEDCIDIDGAQSGVAQAEPERLVLCTGRPDVDPAQAINNITAGECLVFEEQQEYPRRADCSEPEAIRVDGRADDVESPADPSQPLPESICADSGSRSLKCPYSLGSEATSPVSRKRTTGSPACLSPSESGTPEGTGGGPGR